MAQDSAPDETGPDHSNEMSVEERLAALEKQNEEFQAKLEQQQNGGFSDMTRRGALGILGGGALLGAAGSANAQPGRGNGGPPFADEDHDHSGDYLGEDKPLDRIDVGDLNTDSLSGITILRDEMDEATVRKKVSNASPRTGFIIEPGAQWTLKDTLEIPREIIIRGFNRTFGDDYTFKKGFNGTLATITRGQVSLDSVKFHGNKENYAGDGVVDKVPGEGVSGPAVRGVYLARCQVSNCAGDGRVLTNSYMCHHTLCFFMNNGGYGIREQKVPNSAHHSQNLFTRCTMGKNGKGGVALFGPERITLFNNVTVYENAGPAFHHRREENGVLGSFNITIQQSSLLRNDGPGWLQDGGVSSDIVFATCRTVGNVDDPSDNLTTAGNASVGLFHVEKGKLGLEIRGGLTNESQLYSTAGVSESQQLVISGAGGGRGINGNITGPQTFLTVVNDAVLQGRVNVKSGIGLNPTDGGSVVHYGPSESLPPGAQEEIPECYDVILEEEEDLTPGEYGTNLGRRTVDLSSFLSNNPDTIYLRFDDTDTKDPAGTDLYGLTLTADGEAIADFSPGTAAEDPYLYIRDGSSTGLNEVGNHRYVDAEGYWLYEFSLPDGIDSLSAEFYVRNEFLISASTTPTC